MAAPYNALYGAAPRMRRPAPDPTKDFWKALRAGHPRLREALAADARVTAHYRGERAEFRSRADLAVQCVRLAVVSDAFLAQVQTHARAHHLEPPRGRREKAIDRLAPPLGQ